MARKNAAFERRSAARAKRYTPRPHPDITQALEAAGLRASGVYGARRWDKAAIDLDRLGAALYALTVDGWHVAGVGVSPLRYVGAYEPRKGRDPVRAADVRQAEERLRVDKARGLAYVFDRSPDAIEHHLTRHRAVMAAIAADPIKRLSEGPTFSVALGDDVRLTKAELGALATFVSCFAKFHAAIGNGAFTVADGLGVPMTDDARAAAQAAYCDMCARIIKQAGNRALSACQDLASNRALPDRLLLAMAAPAIDGELPAFEAMSGFATKSAV